MALSGYFYGTTENPHIKPKLSWSAVQNQEENYSDITVTLTYSRTNAGQTTAGNWSGGITLGDQTKTGKNYISVTYQSNTEALTATFRVPHDEYGALTVSLSATGEIYDPEASSLKATAVAGKIQTDPIARPSTVSAVNASIGSRTTVVIGRKANGLTHSLAYRFGNLTGWITSDGEQTQTETVFSRETVNFLLPESFYSQIPDRKTDICTLICTTYQGSTVVGQKTASFAVTTDEAVCGPELSVTAKDVAPESLALTANENKFVRYLSEVVCSVSAKARQGATLTKLTAQGTVFTGTSYTLSKPETDTVRFTATDSRGYSASFSLQLDMTGYVMLSTNALVRRADPAGGDGILILQGNCYGGSFPVKNNTLTATYQVAEQSGTTTVPIGENHTYRLEIPLPGLHMEKSYPVTVCMTDEAMSVTQQLTLHKGVPVFDWGEGDFRFHVPVAVPALTVGGMSLADYIRSIVAGG